MSETILIGINNSFSAKTNKWLFCVTGILFLSNVAIKLYAEPFIPTRLMLLLPTLVGGVFSLFYGLFGFSLNSKFAPRVTVTDTKVEWKNSVWKASTSINWSDLSSIKLQSHKITFRLQDSSKTFSYKTNPDVSKSIKQTIREFAERKNVEVIDG